MDILTRKQQKLYNAFYEATHNNEHLDEKTELLVGLSAAIAMNCDPCTQYYLEKARKAQVSLGEISEVIAKVMAVAAGQKRLQAAKSIEAAELNFD